MIDLQHLLPLRKQAKDLGISRGSVYYLPRPVPAADLAVMNRIDKLHLEYPFAGSWTPALTSRVVLFRDSIDPSLIWRRDDGTAVAFRVVGTS